MISIILVGIFVDHRSLRGEARSGTGSVRKGDWVHFVDLIKIGAAACDGGVVSDSLVERTGVERVVVVAV